MSRSNIPPLPDIVSSAIDTAAVIRSLNSARTLEQAVEHLPRHSRLDGLSPLEAVTAVVARAAALTRSERLLAPVEAVFLLRPGVDSAQLETIASLAADILQSYLDEAAADRADPIDGERRRLVLNYAVAFMKQDAALQAIARARSSAPELDGALHGADRRRVEDYLLYRGVNGPRVTLENLTHGWTRLIEDLEADGLSLLYEEYENDLGGRDLLAGVLPLVSPRARLVLDAPLRPLDERFERATHALSIAHHSTSPWSPVAWWWYRVPRRRGESFDAYLSNFLPDIARELARVERDG